MGQLGRIFRAAWGTRSLSTIMNTTRNLSALAALIIVLSAAGMARADDVSVTPAETQTTSGALASTTLYSQFTPFQLLDLSKLTFRHSYSVSYLSSGGYSANRGVYTTSIGYRISDPLYVQLDLGLVHQPGALFGGDSRQLDAQVRPNFFLRYAPSTKFSLIVDVRTMPFYRSGFGSGHWPY